MPKAPLRKADRRHGAALVEMALMLPVFALLALSVIEVGWLIFVRHTMDLATREAVRAMAVREYTPEEAATYARNYLQAATSYTYQISTRSSESDTSVSMEIRVPVSEASILGLKLIPIRGDLVTSDEMVRESVE
jgi:Flp pilus assembly protein TadG